MGKLFISLKLLILSVLLTSAVNSYWSYPDSKAYEYPKEQHNLLSNWYENPQGIFSLNFRQGSVEVNVTAPADINQGTDTDLCNASITVPDATYSGGAISWVMSGASTGSDTGQVGTRTFEKGTTLITYTVKDAEGNTSQDSMEITVNDDQEPEFITENTLSGSTDTGQCTASISVPTVSYSDNCSGESLSWTMSGATSGNGAGQVGTQTFNIGTTTISYTVTDAADNSTTQELEVIVKDEQYPQLTVGSAISETTDSGQCSASISVPTVTFSDNCSGETLSWTMSGATTGTGTGQIGTTVFNAGTTTISYTVTDAANNVTSGFLSIKVTDGENPTITAPGRASGATGDDSIGNCSTTVALGVPSVDDNCELDGYKAFVDGAEIDPATYLFPVGTTTVTWEVSDKAGNTNSDTQEVLVTDNEAPIILAPANSSASTGDNGTGNCSTTVALGSPTTSDNCDEVPTITVLVDGTEIDPVTYPFSAGTTVVTYEAKDTAGNTASDTQEVTVTDNEAPIITAPADKSAATGDDGTGNCSTTIVSGSPTTSDNCGEVTVKAYADGSEIDPVTYAFTTGSTVVTYEATDKAGNKATAAQVITITDNEKPFIFAGADIATGSDTATCGASVTIVPATATDNCSVGEPTGTRDDGQPLNDLYPVGTTTITWSVTDENGNAADPAIQKVTVTDREKPVLTHNGDKNVTTDPGTCGAIVEVSASASDNCTIGNPVGTRSDGKRLDDLYPIGTTTITWTVTDEHGNKGDLLTHTVTVIDNEKPVITAGADMAVVNIKGQCYAGISLTSATAVDNCSVGTPTGTRSDGQPLNATYPVGTTVITWNVTDANGNNALPVEQKIIVEDKEAPVPRVLENVVSGCAYTFEIPTAVDNCTSDVTVTHDKPLTFSSTGTITWSFTDESGNTSTAKQTVTIDPIVTIVADKIDVLCNGHATGEITVSATGGVAPYTFDWGSLGAGDTKTNLPAGTYNVTATDSNGCETAPLEVVIEEPATFVEISGITTTNGCYQQNNGTATVEAKGGVGQYTYLWDDGQTTKTATDLAPGSHWVAVTDANGCTKQRTFTISAPLELKVTGFLTTETTSYGSATGTATAQISGGTPNYTFAWSNGATGQTARDLAAGKYTVTVTDANGCSATKEVTITDALHAVIMPTSICEGEEDIVRTSYFEVEGLTAKGGTPGYTYSWSFGESATPATAVGPGPHRVKYSVIGDKRIVLKVTDSKGQTIEKQINQYVGGCFSNDCGSNDLAAENYFIGDANGTKITSSNCAESGQKYLYISFPTNSERYSLNIEYIYSVTNLSTGEKTNFKEADCFYSQKAIPKVARTIPIDYSCGDLIIIEGIYLTFSNNSNWKCGQGPAPKCYSTNNDTSVTLPLYAVAIPNQLLCNGGTDGVINTRTSGGTGNYSYKLISATDGSTIRPSQSSGSFTGLSAGRYRVIVSDGVDSYTTSEVEVTQPINPLTLDLVSQNEITCFQGSDGSATVAASGGTPNDPDNPYIYIWENIGQTSATATNLAAGIYTVRAIDANGCETSLEVVIEEPEEITANAGPDQVIPCGNLQTFLEAVFEPQVEEGQTQSTGTWSIVNGPAGGVIADVNNPNSKFTGVTGTYTLRWTVSCGASDDVKISFSSCSTLDFDGIDDHVVIGDKFDLPSAFTLEAWIKPDPAPTSGIKTIFSERDLSESGASGFDLVIENQILKYRWNDSSISSKFTIGTDRWYHVAVILGGDDSGLYVDGIKVSEDVPGKPNATANPFVVGAAYDSATPSRPKNYFHGWIEEIRIWKRALSIEQLRFLMNQRLNIGTTPLQGTALPIPVPGPLNSANDLIAYYPLIVTEITNGITIDKGPNGYHGQMVNIVSLQENSAPLPYFSAKNGKWTADDTWLRPAVWDHPNSKGIDGTTFIDWNIVATRHNISSENKDITVLGLRNEAGKLSITDPNGPQNETNPGQMLKITHYLKLDGSIDLFGESQLIQNEGSLLDPASKGKLERDQQGTASSYNYNYWTSPVSISTDNQFYAIATVMKDGTTTTPRDLSFGPQYHYADGSFTNPRRVSSYWLHKFHGTANNYFAWEHISPTEPVPVGEGFSMKGTSGYASKDDLQNYTFVGMPNNGTIKLKINETPEGENYLVGNPYPSAIDARKFIKDNIVSSDINQSSFNGTLYFWDHFAKTSHYLEQYVGGYAVYNLAGSIEPASSVDSRIDNSNPNRTGSKRPGDYIPVGQAFFVNTIVQVEGENVVSTGGDTIRFRNEHRYYKREIDKDAEGNPASVFHSQERKGGKSSVQKETRKRIWIKSRSPLGYHRQLLVTADPNTTDNFDLGYDAPLIDDTKEDMYWIINDSEFVIQGVPDFNKTRVLPLGIRLHEKGEITIQIDELENIPEDFGIYLKDSLTQTTHDLRNSAFSATAEAGKTHNRFSIVFQKEPTNEGEEPGDEGSEDPGEDEITDPTEGEDDKDEEENIEDNSPSVPEVFYSTRDDEIVIKNPDHFPIKKGTLFNALGQKIMEFDNISAKSLVELPVHLSVTGVYIFSLELASGSKYVKFIVE